MPYIPWWKSHGLVLYPWFTTMWNGTIRKCLAREFWIMLKQITNLIFQVKKLLWMLLRGKSKDTRARYNNTTNKLLAKKLKVNLVATKDEQRNNKEQEMRKKQKEKLTFVKLMTNYSRCSLTINRGFWKPKHARNKNKNKHNANVGCEVQTPTMDDDAHNIKTPSSLNAKLMNKKLLIVPSNKCFVALLVCYNYVRRVARTWVAFEPMCLPAPQWAKSKDIIT